MPEAYPKEYCDTWDDNHVKMPCSKHNLFLVHQNNKVCIYLVTKNLI